MSIEYWRGLEECTCRSELPIGGCLKCDLDEMQAFIEATEKLIAALDDVSLSKIAVTKLLERVK